MLTSLSLRNFKSWREIKDMRLAPITVLFGPNSSGKSSIIQFLLMLKQTVESPDRQQVLNLGSEKTYAHLGTQLDIINKRSSDPALSFSFLWECREPIVIPVSGERGEITFQDRNFRFESSIQIANPARADGLIGRIQATSMAYTIGSDSFSLHQKLQHKPRQEARYELEYSGDKDFSFRRPQGRAWELPEPNKFYGFPDKTRVYYQNAYFLAILEEQLESLFRSMHYLGPLREYPKRQYTWAGAKPGYMGDKGERVIDVILSAQERNVRMSKRKLTTLQEMLAVKLKEIGLAHSFEVERVEGSQDIYRVYLRINRDSDRILITDVGFGISQILPVLTMCYSVPERSIVIFEQPEIHLHPRAASGLADVFIHAMKMRGVQFIIESHSEHLLRRLQRRIAEQHKGLANDDVALYFCSYEENESKLEPLNVNLYGDITNWPDDFFGDELAEVAARQVAALKRKIKDADK